MKSLTLKNDVFIVLYNVRSVQNVASIFRTVDCLGIPNIFLVGYTPTPVDRFGRARKDFTKVSLGAEQTVAWKQFATMSQVLRAFKEREVFTIAVEQATGSKDYKKIKPQFPVAFIFGNEVEGIPEKILTQCDVVAEIPMHGKKESLNVSVAAGIALAQMLNR